MMLAPLASLAFLATLWLLAVTIAEMLGESGGKMPSALNGRSLMATAPKIRPIAGRVSQRSRLPTLRAQLQPTLRAAA